MLARPPGFSPFRSVAREETKDGTTISPPQTSMAFIQDEVQDSGQVQGLTRAHGWGHGKQIKHDFGHSHTMSMTKAMGTKGDMALAMDINSNMAVVKDIKGNMA